MLETRSKFLKWNFALFLLCAVRVLAAGSDFKEFPFLRDGTVFYTLEDVSKAEEAIRAALRKDPNSEAAKFYLAIAHERRSRLEAEARTVAGLVVLINVVSVLETNVVVMDKEREKKSEHAIISLDRAEYRSRDEIEIEVTFRSRDGGDFYNILLNGGKPLSFRLGLFDSKKQMVGDFGAHVDGSVWGASLSDWYTLPPKGELRFTKRYSLQSIKRLKSAGDPYLRSGQYSLQLVYFDRIYAPQGSDFKSAGLEKKNKDAISSNLALFTITE